MVLSMSTDPSPWAAPESIWQQEPDETTDEMLERAEQERQEEDAAVCWDRIVWQRYAHRLRKDGGMTR